MKEIPFDPEHIDDPWFLETIPGFDDYDQLSPEVVERIKDAVEALPQDERDVVELVVWGQMSKVDIAVELGRSRQSVHDVLGRGLRRLRTILADLEGL